MLFFQKQVKYMSIVPQTGVGDPRGQWRPTGLVREFATDQRVLDVLNKKDLSGKSFKKYFLHHAHH